MKWQSLQEDYEETIRKNRHEFRLKEQEMKTTIATLETDNKSMKQELKENG